MPRAKTTAPAWLEELASFGLTILQDPNNRDERRPPEKRFDRATKDFLTELPKLSADLDRIVAGKPPQTRGPITLGIVISRDSLLDGRGLEAGALMGNGINNRLLAMLTPAIIWSHPDLRRRLIRCALPVCRAFVVRDPKAPHAKYCCLEHRRAAQ